MIEQPLDLHLVTILVAPKYVNLYIRSSIKLYFGRSFGVHWCLNCDKTDYCTLDFFFFVFVSNDG